MGMAASQARFLSLTARKTNVEYEGQQINQQRTSLSNQSSNYYSQLCNLVVPTPPSSEDFSKTVYTFEDGTETNTVNALIAQPNGWYILNYTQTYETENVVSNGAVMATRIAILDENNNPVLNANQEPTYTYNIAGSTLRQIGAIPTTEPERTDFINNDDYLSQIKNTDQINDILILEEQYRKMLEEKYGTQDWYVRYAKTADNKSWEPIFYSKTQLENADFNDKTGQSLNGIKTYVYGQTTETREVKNAKARVEQDTSGRYISITIYETNPDGSVKEENGKQIGTTYSLTATTDNNNAAYNDAVNEYNYAKAKYDHAIEAINAKIEIVHGQDKDLELRLKQLDTEQKAISTEMETVEKVISKNVDNSFKTFNA